MRHEWLVVRRQQHVTYWLEHASEELMCETVSCGALVADCARYLPDPGRQARLDLPRMSVRIDGRRVRSLEELERHAPAADLPLLRVLCTQVLFAGAYECAGVGLPEPWFVCEAAPARAAEIEIATRGRVTGLRATKRMRTLDPDSTRERTVTLAVTMDFVHDTVEVTASRARFARR